MRIRCGTFSCRLLPSAGVVDLTARAVELVNGVAPSSKSTEEEQSMTEDALGPAPETSEKTLATRLLSPIADVRRNEVTSALLMTFDHVPHPRRVLHAQDRQARYSSSTRAAPR